MVGPGEHRMLDLIHAFQEEVWFNPPGAQGFEQLEGDEFLDAVDAWGREIIAGLPRPVSEEELQQLGEQVFGLSGQDDYTSYLAYSMAVKAPKDPDPQRQRMLIYHQLGRSSYLTRIRGLSEIWSGKRLATPEDETYEKLIEGTLQRHARQVVDRLQSHPDENVAMEQRVALKEKISTVPDEYARSKLETLLDYIE